jgi:AAA domain/DnaB-like helicase N terminal domain
MPGTPADDAAALRQPPHSNEAEYSVLGALLIDPSAFPKIADTLAAGDFYSHAHRLIFGAISRMIAAGKAVDTITVFDELGDAALEIGGLKYLNAISQSVPSAANIVRYSEIIAERATLRSIIATADQASARAFRGEAAASILDDAKLTLGRLLDARNLPSGRVPLLSLQELRKQAHAVTWLIKGVVPAACTGMMFGASGTFKSFIALDACLHVAHGLPWLGRKTKQGEVLFLAAEGGTGLWQRIAAWHRARHLQWDKVPMKVVPVSIDLSQDAWKVVESAQAQAAHPALVVIDTMSQTFGGEENVANEVAAYFREIGARFRQLWGCTVLVIHHSGHSATERPRGSSAILGNVDFLFGVYRDEKEMMATLTCLKQKDGERFNDTTFRVGLHNLEKDEDGDWISSLVARHLTTAEDVQEAMEAESKAGRGGNNHLLLSLLSNGQKEGDLRSAFYAECDASTADGRRQAYHRARKWAETNGLMEVSQGYVITLTTGG